MQIIDVSIYFITKGHSLSCYECMGLTGSCAEQKVKTCPKYVELVFPESFLFSGDSSTKVKVKDCAADCVSGSMNIGIVKTSLVCCNTDQCNVQDAPDPSNVPNGNKCYYCDGQSCSNTVSCSGIEDRCFKATGQSLVLKGFNDVQSISCCSGNLCNGAQSVTQSFLFLCCSLLSFILLH
uniref:Snake toxin/toxin-like domain-containing protein n=1 Tax=Cyprinus carpio TaxID=7962 RepID=A0A8C2HA06_CYPCA